MQRFTISARAVLLMNIHESGPHGLTKGFLSDRFHILDYGARPIQPCLKEHPVLLHIQTRANSFSIVIFANVVNWIVKFNFLNMVLNLKTQTRLIFNGIYCMN